MTEYRAKAHGFNSEITAIVEVENGEILKISAEGEVPNTVGALGVDTWLEEANAEHSVEVDAISGASVSTGALRKAAQMAYAEATGGDVDAISSASIHNQPNNYPLLKEKFYEGDIEFDDEYDVIVVGAGGAGLSAAATAAENGASVLAIEKQGIPGGTTSLSGGVMQAAGTKYQKEFTDYKDDTPEKHEAEYLAAGEGRLYEPLVRDFTQNAGKNLEWLEDKVGVKWTSVYGHTEIPYTKDSFADRIHVYEGGGAGGNGIIATRKLYEYALNQGAEFQFDTAVVALVLKDETSSEVAGVIAEQGGVLYAFKANRGVILSAASIDQNVELAKDLSPQHYEDVKRHLCWSVASDRGDGIVMGMNIGAAVTGFGGTIDFDARTGNGTDDRLPTIPSIFVNGQGLRFVNEDATYAYGFRAIFNEEKKLGKPTYQIFGKDSITSPTSPWNEASLAKDVESGLVKTADSLEELAGKIGVPAENLVKSVETWNKHAAEGRDPEYERAMVVKPFNGPYYAYTNTPGNLGAIGGLKINAQCNVIDNFGQPIPGLYAAGMNAGGWIGSYYPGSGTAVSGAIHQGRRAAKSILGLS